MCLCLLSILWPLVCLIDRPWGEQEERQETVRTYSIFKNNISYSLSLPGQKIGINITYKKTRDSYEIMNFFSRLAQLNLGKRQLFCNMGDIFQYNTSVTGVEMWLSDNQSQHVSTYNVSQNQHTGNRSDCELPSDLSACAKLKECKTVCLYWEDELEGFKSFPHCRAF